MEFDISTENQAQSKTTLRGKMVISCGWQSAVKPKVGIEVLEASQTW